MGNLDELQRTIDDESYPSSETKQSSPKSFVPFISIPVVLLIAMWFWSETQDAICTIIITVILVYGFMALVQGMMGEPLPPPIEPELPEGVDVPEEFEGRPKLFLAYLIEQAAEQDDLRRIVAARPPGNDPLSRHDKWDRL